MDDSVNRFKAMTPELVAQLWAEARYYYKSGYDELYISGALYKKFQDDQFQYKNCNDSLLFNFLSEALDMPYADFDNDLSLRDQYRNPDLYNNRSKKVQDFFSLTALSALCRDNHYEIYKNHGFAQFADWSGKFEYGKQWNGMTQVRGLIRIKPASQPVQTDSNPLLKLDEFGNITV